MPIWAPSGEKLLFPLVQPRQHFALLPHVPISITKKLHNFIRSSRFLLIIIVRFASPLIHPMLAN